MRAALLMIALAGCGPVELGHERALDAGLRLPKVEVVVSVANSGCKGCFELHASGQGGKAPYHFEWDNGSHSATRRVCPADGIDTVSVTATDAHHERSAAETTSLEFPDASCPPPPQLLCIKNPSFEGKPAFNDGDPSHFDGAPWSQCTNPSMANTPEIGNNTIQQPVATPPAATDGKTFLGLEEGEQVSQKLCEPVEGGTVLYLKLDAQRLYIGAGVTPDTELPSVQIWGGVASDCTQRELLWASEPLPNKWKTYCVKLHPQQYTDQITLRASSDNSLPFPSYLLLDNLVPVTSCP